MLMPRLAKITGQKSLAFSNERWTLIQRAWRVSASPYAPDAGTLRVRFPTGRLST